MLIGTNTSTYMLSADEHLRMWDSPSLRPLTIGFDHRAFPLPKRAVDCVAKTFLRSRVHVIKSLSAEDRDRDLARRHPSAAISENLQTFAASFSEFNRYLVHERPNWIDRVSFPSRLDLPEQRFRRTDESLDLPHSITQRRKSFSELFNALNFLTFCDLFPHQGADFPL